MEDLQWSEAKQELLSFPDNAVVSASAGTGKTTALVEFIVRWLAGETEEDPRTLQNMVAITYTEKAAEEMKERLQEFLMDRIERAEQEERWHRARRSLSAAYIGTIHAFCSRLLRENAVRFGVDPDFSVLDERESQRHLFRIVQDWIVDTVRAEKDSGETLLHNFGFQEGPSRYGNDVTGVLMDLLNDFWNHGNRSPDVITLMRQRFQDAERELEAEVDRAISAVDQIVHLPDGELSAKSQESVQKFRPIASELRDWLRDLNEGTEMVRFHEFKERTKPVLKGNVSKALSEARKPLRETLGYPSSRRRSGRGSLEDLVAFLKSRSLYEKLLDGFKQVEKRYRRFKEEHGFLDYHDLLFMTRDKLRSDPALRREYKEQFDLLLVDEFQDVNELQYEILFYLSEEMETETTVSEEDQVRDRITLEPRKFIVVGDEKQSIYRFRGADVVVFNDMYREVKNQRGKTFSFQENFRSLPALTQFFNAFGRTLFGEHDEPFFADFSPGDRLIPSRASREELSPRIELLSPPEPSGSSREMRQLEGETIAKRIQEMTGHLDREALRVLDDDEEPGPLSYGDIAILFRTTSHVKDYERALQDRDIPYHLFKGQDFFETPEIRDVDTLFRFLANPRDDIAFLGVLKSPLIGVSEDTVISLNARQEEEDPNVSLFSLLKREIPSVPENEEEKLKRARAFLEEMMDLRDRVPPSDLLAEARKRVDLDTVLAQGPRGEQARVNMEKLEALLADRTESEQFTFLDAAAYLRDAVRKGVVEEEAPVPADEENRVRLMTVHSAKGLEFPCVIMADTGSVKPRVQGTIHYDPDWGIGLRWRDPESDISHSTWAYSRVKDRLKEKQKAESLRLFYVAMTRARDYIVFSGWFPEGPYGNPRTKDRWWSHLNAFLEEETDALVDLFSHPPVDRVEQVTGEEGQIDVRFRSFEDVSDVPERETGKAESLLSDLDFESEDVSTNIVFSGNADAREEGPSWRFQAVTEFIELLNCPRRYAFLYHDRVPDDIGQEHLLPEDRLERHHWRKAGSAAHQVLQHSSLESESDVNRLKELLNRSAEGKLLPEDIRTEVLERVEGTINRLQSEHWMEREYRDAREFPFVLSFEGEKAGVTLEGKVDLLVETDRAFHLYDFKFARKRQIAPEDDRKQLLLYSRAFSERARQAGKSIQCNLVYMREDPSNMMMSVEATSEKRDPFLEDIHQALEILGRQAENPAIEWPGEETREPCDQRRCGFIPYCWGDSP